MKIKRPTNYEQHLEEFLRKPGMRELYDEYGRELEAAYKIAELRAKHKLSQAQLAKKIGTTQSNIARMESGEQNMTISLLGKVAHAFGKELKISFV